MKARLAALEEAERGKADKALQDDYARLRKFEQDTLAKQQETARQAIRTKNLDEVLKTIAEEKRADAELIIMGMVGKGAADIDTEGAATKLIEKLGKDRPDWFKQPPNGAGLNGGTPGVGLPVGGSLLTLPAEQIAALSDDQLKAYMAANQAQSKRI